MRLTDETGKRPDVVGLDECGAPDGFGHIVIVGGSVLSTGAKRAHCTEVRAPPSVAFVWSAKSARACFASIDAVRVYWAYMISKHLYSMRCSRANARSSCKKTNCNAYTTPCMRICLYTGKASVKGMFTSGNWCQLFLMYANGSYVTCLIFCHKRTL